MRRISKLLIAILCTLLSFEPVRAETNNLTGQWKQISSNAGNCSNCFIGIMKHGRIFTISANNHWTATLEVESYGPAKHAFGEGNWSLQSGSYSGKKFEILIALRDGKLYMVMIVDRANGHTQTIEATFTKIFPEPHLPIPLRRA